jgi:hypothetical protein
MEEDREAPSADLPLRVDVGASFREGEGVRPPPARAAHMIISTAAHPESENQFDDECADDDRRYSVEWERYRCDVCCKVKDFAAADSRSRQSSREGRLKPEFALCGQLHQP